MLESEHVLCSLIFNKNLCLSCCLFQFSFETELAEYHDGYTIRDMKYDYRYVYGIGTWHLLVISFFHEEVANGHRIEVNTKIG